MPDDPLAALAAAHEALVVELRSAIKQYRPRERSCRGGRFSNGTEVCDAIEDFVGELVRIPKVKRELQRRAHHVELATERPEFIRAVRGAHGAFRAQKTQLAARVQKRRRTADDDRFIPGAVNELRRFFQIQRIAWLFQFSGVRRALKRLRDLSFANQRSKAAYKQLETECRRIEREAAGQEVDGCYYLWRVYEAQGDAADPLSILTRSAIATGGWPGGIHLRRIRAAANAMMKWARDGAGPTPKINGKSVKRLTLAEANEKAMKLAKGDREFVRKGQREWAERIGCAVGQIVNLPFWREVAARTGRDRKAKGKAPRVVSLTDKVLAVTPDSRAETELDRLIREQEAERRHEKVRSRKKL